MLDYLVGLVSRLGHWGYLIIFLAAALELGRRLGRPWLEHHGRRFGLSRGRLKRADAFFERHGGKSVFLGRFVGFARALVPFLAGASRMPYARFLSYNALGAVLWAICFVLLGYFAGASWQRAERWVGAASAIVGGVVLTALLLVWLWRWAVRHELEIKRRWNGYLQHSRLARVGRRFAPQIAFVRARLSPRSYLGLQLTVGALVLIGASWLFVGITEDLLYGDPLAVVDREVARWFDAHSNASLTQLMRAISDLHGTTPVVAMICALALPLAYLVARVKAWQWRVMIVLIAFFVVALVGLSRVYLGVDFLSDVLAGMAVGVAWLALCLTAVNTLRGAYGLR